MTKPLTDDAATYDGYLFVHFQDESSPDGEQVYFSLSQDSSLRGWQELNGGRPVLRTAVGTGGVRDPFVLRLQDGSFVIIATDLRVFGIGDFVSSQEHGSRSLLVWRSPDLVTWSGPELVEVAGAQAGNVWAPEAIWVEEIGRYAVYWASNLYPEGEGTRRNEDSYNRMMITTTADFVHFEPATPWIDVRRGPGYGTIDSTVARDERVGFVRITKDEEPDTMDVVQEHSEDLFRATTGSLGSSWQLQRERIGAPVVSHAEGPILVRSNTDERWFLLVDWPPYGGGSGYVVLETEDLVSGEWRPSDVTLPAHLRHGSVLQVTAQERARLEAAFPVAGTGHTASDADNNESGASQDSPAPAEVSTP